MPAGNIFADVGLFQNGAGPVGGIEGSSLENTLTAVGATQGAGLVLRTGTNVVTASTASTGIATVLPVGFKGARVEIINTTANALSVFPPVGGTVNAGSANAADAGTVAAAASGVAGVKVYRCTDTAGLTWLRTA